LTGSELGVAISMAKTEQSNAVVSDSGVEVPAEVPAAPAAKSPQGSPSPSPDGPAAPLMNGTATHANGDGPAAHAESEPWRRR
jgi:hypothetical protein